MTCRRCGEPKPANIHHLWACCGDGPGYGDHIKPETLACRERQLEQAEAKVTRLTAALTDMTGKLQEAGKQIGEAEGREMLAQGEVTRLTAELANLKASKGDRCAACGAEWMGDNAIDELSDMVEAKCGQRLTEIRELIVELQLQHAKTRAAELVLEEFQRSAAVVEERNAKLTAQLEEAKSRVEEESHNYVEMMELRDVALRQAAKAKRELEEAKAERKGFEVRAHERRSLLAKMVKYVRNDNATTPNSPRLARLTDQVADYLQRTADPRDILRAPAPSAKEEPNAKEEQSKAGIDQGANPQAAASGSEGRDRTGPQDAAAISLRPRAPGLAKEEPKPAEGGPHSGMEGRCGNCGARSCDLSVAECKREREARANPSTVANAPSGVELSQPAPAAVQRVMLAAYDKLAQLEADAPPVSQPQDSIGRVERVQNCLAHARRAHEQWMKRYEDEAGTFEDDRFAWLLKAVEELSGKQGN